MKRCLALTVQRDADGLKGPDLHEMIRRDRVIDKEYVGAVCSMEGIEGAGTVVVYSMGILAVMLMKSYDTVVAESQSMRYLAKIDIYCD